MNFASYDFWQTLFFCFVASRLVIGVAGRFLPSREKEIGKLCLLATGLVLLGAESLLTLSVFLWVVALSWIGVVLAGRGLFSRRSFACRALFLLLLLGQLAPLFYYKYWNFVLNDWFGLGVAEPSVLIPMGLSFYTFQKLGFWIDTIRQPCAPPRLLDYLNYCSFFPQIVAGPIEKKDSLLPQIEATGFRVHRENLESALPWIVLGLAYKLIVADNLGNLSQKLHVDSGNAWHVWVECIAFALRIYFDFAGYSFVAVGLALILGVRLTLNFRCPYWSKDLREFWRNWHVTLGAWLRDYIYIPLGGRRSSRWMLNTILVFLISGIWHGAGWGFVIWGLLHGIGVAFCGIGKPWTRLAPLRWFFTLAYTVAAWLFFFESDTLELKAKAASLCNPSAYGLGLLGQIPVIFNGVTHSLTMGLIFMIALALLGLEGLGVRKNLEPYRLARTPACCMLLVVLTVFLAPMEESQFIYFNF